MKMCCGDYQAMLGMRIKRNCVQCLLQGMCIRETDLKRLRRNKIKVQEQQKKGRNNAV